MTLNVRLQATGPIALDLSFQVEPGEVLALVGPSGSGKSTVLRSIAGLWTPTQAHVGVAGEVWHDSETHLSLPTHQRKVGMVFQSYALFPHLDALGNVTLAMGDQPRAQREKAARALLARVGLSGFEARRPADLSGGQQQRVAIARALARDPMVLLLDEPFSAVDRPMREGLYETLQSLRSVLAMPTVLVTHDMDEAQRLADRMVVIEAGRALSSGTAAEVLCDPRALRTLGLREAGSMITAIVEAEEEDDLSRLRTVGGPLYVPKVSAAPGTRLRLRIPAHDVMIALERPVGLSALNVLPVVVRAVVPGDGPGVMLRLGLGEEEILARVTQRSARHLGVQPGLACFAVLKSMAVARDQLRT
ncbi:MAG: molybdenum ABC transporter ATP-binding protein [Rhodobacteraceae bacterium]|nr:molybdenum ABC transporter ATP-binding protein [Paracoccaceae bacterium]MCF8513177.1 molybdenum ABC transporter ATP-binding protein [Paracoccaceae bacterium]MCF8517421.1 molybdenum ABC transporter ATP-binding protein [Paracoccaceae bacterium]